METVEMECVGGPLDGAVLEVAPEQVGCVWCGRSGEAVYTIGRREDGSCVLVYRPHAVLSRDGEGSGRLIPDARRRAEEWE